MHVPLHKLFRFLVIDFYFIFFCFFLFFYWLNPLLHFFFLDLLLLLNQIIVGYLEFISVGLRIGHNFSDEAGRFIEILAENDMLRLLMIQDFINWSINLCNLPWNLLMLFLRESSSLKILLAKFKFFARSWVSSRTRIHLWFVVGLLVSRIPVHSRCSWGVQTTFGNFVFEGNVGLKWIVYDTQLLSTPMWHHGHYFALLGGEMINKKLPPHNLLSVDLTNFDKFQS